MPKITTYSAIAVACLMLCGNNRGIAQQGYAVGTTFTELADPTKDTLSDWSAVKAGLHASFVSIDKRYPKSVNPDLTIQRSATLFAWKGEQVSAQLLLWTAAAAPSVTVSNGELKTGKGQSISADAVQTRFVRYVMTDEFASGCGHRKPEDFKASLSPDMLDDLKSFDLEAKKVRPVWITVKVPASASAGEYKTTISVKEKGKVVHNLDLIINVQNHIMPPASDWTFHLDQWQHPSAVARVNNVKVWSDEHFEALKPTMKQLAAAGQKVITATLNKDAWNVQTYDPYADMIIWKKTKAGTWVYDYAIFDRWVQFMMDLGINKQINCYSLLPWNNEVHYFDEAKNEFVNVIAKPGTAVFEELWTPFLKDFSKHVSAKGWLKITNIAMDERGREEMDPAIALLERVAPEFGVAFADNHKSYQRYQKSTDISVAVGDPFDHNDLVQRRKKGYITTFYVCCSDEFPNQFTFSDPAESTYMAWYALAAGFDGALRWAFNSWVEDPLRDSRFRTWPAGDTYIVYPQGRSSIRYERMLEGIQDYTKVGVLRAKLEKSQDWANLTKLNAKIAKLNMAKRYAEWNQDLNDAKAFVNELSSQLN
ncbi:glycoside hydrolase domain-containing protein [Sphingobacterium thalpophilum]|uniref:Glycoside hydrolase domain-containing protein n=1 Tax=Sphingobacterium thalpophilum TaxID=259 RepID=A0ABV4HGB7_9SPHI